MKTIGSALAPDVDVAVIGGGLVGAAVAFGLARRGLRIAVLDEGDLAQRASRSNFGLVWVQTKGNGLPAYLHWTRRSADAWPDFARSLEELTGVSIEYRQDGGLVYCLGDAELEARRAAVQRLRLQADIFDTRMLDRADVEALVPRARLGREVTGASYCPHDGHCNPLQLLHALHRALQAHGVAYRPNAPVRSIDRRGGGYAIVTPAGVVAAGKVVLAAGHGNSVLGPPLGLDAPVRASRGQILVTERMRPFLPIPASGLRQTRDGTVLIGTSKEDVGHDDGTTVDAGARMAARALRVVPELANVRLTRTWGGIRALTPDSGPVYAESESHAGVYLATCHSGVTLAAVHATDLADAIAEDRLDASLQPFGLGRFDVLQAA